MKIVNVYCTIYGTHTLLNMDSTIMADSDIDWAMQNQLRREWLANNPDAEYPGWLSI